jgi:hypothetical protein
MKTIKSMLKDAKDLDPNTPVLALSCGGYASDYMAGEIGEGPCLLLQDLEKVLIAAEPRSDEDVFNYIAEKRLSITWIDSIFDSARKLLITSSEGFDLYESSYEFPVDVSLSSMLRDGINYIIDMGDEPEIGESFFYDVF